MNPEQVERVFISLGEIKATMSEHSRDIKSIKDTVTGNGHPEQSMVAVLHDTRRIVLELRESKEAHAIRIKALEDCSAKKSMETEIKTATKRKVIAVVAALFKKNPILASAITAALGALATWGGFAIESLFAK